SGSVLDGDGQPIPDAILEFWNKGDFTRVATTENGAYSVVLPSPINEKPETGNSACGCMEVLIFMRGLLKPVYSRVYFTGAAEMKYDAALKSVAVDRLQTLLARSASVRNQFEWTVRMQGEDETVFFEF